MERTQVAKFARIVFSFRQAGFAQGGTGVLTENEWVWLMTGTPLNHFYERKKDSLVTIVVKIVWNMNLRLRKKLNDKSATY